MGQQLQYTQPPYHVKYPRPYEPGHIKGTKKQWRICAVCRILFVCRLRDNHTKTCGSQCSNINQHNNVRDWRNSERGKKWKREYDQANKEKYNAQARARYAVNPEKYRAKTRAKRAKKEVAK